jgi:hypothetical protein
LAVGLKETRSRWVIGILSGRTGEEGLRYNVVVRRRKMITVIEATRPELTLLLRLRSGMRADQTNTGTAGSLIDCGEVITKVGQGNRYREESRVIYTKAMVFKLSTRKV